MRVVLCRRFKCTACKCLRKCMCIVCTSCTCAVYVHVVYVRSVSVCSVSVCVCSVCVYLWGMGRVALCKSVSVRWGGVRKEAARVPCVTECNPVPELETRCVSQETRRHMCGLLASRSSPPQ